MRREKWETLLSNLRQQPAWLIAFSGGADSTFLLAAALQAVPRHKVLAVTAVSPSLAEAERVATESLARDLGAEYLALATEELSNPLYASNPPNRCFYCKDELFQKLSPLAQARGMVVADGFNTSDRSDFRPGFQAAGNWNVKHPLDEAGLDKTDIRVLSRWMNLPTWNKAASPCLSSRIPYGLEVTPQRLKQIERAEAAVRAQGFRIVRVRHFKEEARIEVPRGDLQRLQSSSVWKVVEEEVLACGYQRVIADPRGFQSGRLNAPTEKLPSVSGK